MTLSEYNFQYLLDIFHAENKNYELSKIMNAVDKEITGKTASNNSYLFHLVPIMYCSAIATGLSVYIYKLLF